MEKREWHKKLSEEVEEVMKVKLTNLKSRKIKQLKQKALNLRTKVN